MSERSHEGAVERITPVLRTFVSKRWGWEDIITNSKPADYCLKKLFVKAGHETSMHRHPIKDETIMVLEGSLLVEYVQEVATGPLRVKLSGPIHYGRMRLGPGEAIRIEPTAWHRLRATTEDALLVESSTYHDDNDKETWEGPV